MTRPARIRAAWGCALLLAPDTVLHAVGDRRDDTRTRLTARTLGGRELLQALLSLRGGSQAVLVGAAVDATHCVTMLALAAHGSEYRRPAAASAFAAGYFAVAGACAAF